MTCDGWQASNTDGYFAVTAHWIKALTPKEWELSSALIGCMASTMHMSVNILDKLCSRSSSTWGLKTRCIATHEFTHMLMLTLVVTLTTHLLKVGHVTCDNARNNITMMKEFMACLEVETGTLIQKNLMRMFLPHTMKLAW